MIFDKTKAMRNAERYLAQGKIRSAIGEYKQVVEHDPKDFGTMNMLGDMYTKNSEKKAAVACYTSVAEHYSKQGFAQKAIAIYNKISKIEPHSVEVLAKLAELYKIKGSLKEARSHYTTLAEHYQSSGRKMEALAIWKQIALLDPNNTDAYLSLAESYLQENQIDEAADAFFNAASRLSKQGKREETVKAYSRALDLKQDDSKILSGFVEAKFALGRPDEAAQRLSEILEQQPHNKDIRFLLIDCHLESGNTAEAEKAVIKLVEHEPANYPKFLELANVYFAENDFDSASRILSMSSEHLLVGGQAEDFRKIVSDILEKKPEQLEALRLLARHCSWQRDEVAFKDALERLASIARQSDMVEDERYALSQLVLIAPHEVGFANRLKELNQLHGFDESDAEENLFDKRFLKNGSINHATAFDINAVGSDDLMNGAPVQLEASGFGEHNSDFAIVKGSNGSNGSSNGFKTSATAFTAEILDDHAFDFATDDDEAFDETDASAASISAELKLQKEVDSIKFYIESGYVDLAEKTIAELRSEFGDRPELRELTEHLAAFSALESGAAVESVPEVGVLSDFAVDDAVDSLPEVQEDLSSFAEEIEAESRAEIHDLSTFAEDEAIDSLRESSDLSESKTFDLSAIRSEFGLEEAESIDDSDYDTHYHTAVAYQEMGLLEEALKEFQLAVSLVLPNDGTRRFFSCANLLGHCFMQKGMANLALKWYKRTLETSDLNDEEKQGLWYELAGAYEADGDMMNAAKYFEQVYAENVNFRDVSARVKNLMVNH